MQGSKPEPHDPAMPNLYHTYASMDLELENDPPPQAPAKCTRPGSHLCRLGPHELGKLCLLLLHLLLTYSFPSVYCSAESLHRFWSRRMLDACNHLASASEAKISTRVGRLSLQALRAYELTLVGTQSKTPRARAYNHLRPLFARRWYWWVHYELRLHAFLSMIF